MKKIFVILTLTAVFVTICLTGCFSDDSHRFGEWTVTKQASCTEAGEMTRSCSECGETEKAVIPTLAHDLGDWVKERDPSCAEKGVELRSCKREGCEYYEERLTDKLPHTYGDWGLEREPSCFAEGLEARYCSECNNREERLTGRLNDHELTEWSILREPTCSVEGLKERYCECGDREEAPIPTIPHEYGEWQTESEATCTKAGTEARFCECGDKETRPSALAPHTYGNWVYTEPTCTEEGKRVRECVCGDVEEEILPVREHRYGNWVTTVTASCIARGKEVRRCACGHMEARYSPKVAHKIVTDEAVKPTQSSFGKTEGSHCSFCGTVFVAQEQIDKLPTPVNTDMLSFFSYEDKGNKLVFYWKTTEAYKNKLRKILITVNADGASKTFEVSASEEKFEFTPSSTKTNYGFSAAPVDQNFYQGKSLSRVCYWNPEAKELSFPRVEITTQYGELPTYQPSGGPAGTWGGGIINANYVQSLISVYDENDTLLYRSSASDFSKAKIKVRGNTSARSPKEPFKIKLDKKADLLAGLVERDETKDYKDKNWLLLKSGYDPSLALGYTMSELVGRQYSPAYRYVSLFVNGDFRGLYVLMEPVDDGETRCNISDTGYIIEMDAYYWNEPFYFTTPIAIATPGVRPVGYTFKAPDPDNFTNDSPEVVYIQQYMTDLENALLNGGDVSKYLDIRSCAEWLLVHDIMSTWDSGGSNMYLTKYDNTDASIVYMGPNWDFDSAFWSFSYDTNQFARIRYNDHFYMYLLVNNAEFKRIYKELYSEIRDEIFAAVKAELAVLDTEAYQTLLTLENERWGSSHKSYSYQKNQIISWFAAHLSWMDGAVNW